jgi:hypothetical protein
MMTVHAAHKRSSRAETVVTPPKVTYTIRQNERGGNATLPEKLLARRAFRGCAEAGFTPGVR